MGTWGGGGAVRCPASVAAVHTERPEGCVTVVDFWLTETDKNPLVNSKKESTTICPQVGKRKPREANSHTHWLVAPSLP